MRIPFYTLGYLALLLGCALPASTAEMSKDIKAVIAAPAKIQLANTGTVPLVISVIRVSGKLNRVPLPEKIRVYVSSGTFEIGNSDVEKSLHDNTLELKTPPTPYPLRIRLGRSSESDRALRITVMTAEDNWEILGSTEIKLLHVARVEFTEATQTIPADGKSTGKISMRVTDQQGNPVPNLPFMLAGRGPSALVGTASYNPEISVPAITDKEGVATFVLPPSSWGGRFVPSVNGKEISTRQFEIHYEDEKFYRQSRSIKEGDWWKTPIDLPYPGRP